METEIRYIGPGPFDLPTAQRAHAEAHTGNGVTLTFYCKLHGHDAASEAGQEPRAGKGPDADARSHWN